MADKEIKVVGIKWADPLVDVSVPWNDLPSFRGPSLERSRPSGVGELESIAVLRANNLYGNSVAGRSKSFTESQAYPIQKGLSTVIPICYLKRS